MSNLSQRILQASRKWRDQSRTSQCSNQSFVKELSKPIRAAYAFFKK
jgi:hypothetical protein